jgi:hypothetical protein
MSAVAIESNPNEILRKLMKYLFEGLAVAVAAFYLPRINGTNTLSNEEIITIAVTAAAILALLDVFSPSIGRSFRLGSGFGIGSNLVGFH